MPRGVGTKKVRKQVEKEAIVDKWDKSSRAQRRVVVQKRRALTDSGGCSFMLACFLASRER
jgi:large subunit ribosomal protein L14e